MTFPDVRWGSEQGWLRRAAIGIGSSRPGSWLIRSLTPLDRALLQRSDGRYTLLGPIGAPTLLLETTGAKSGLARVSPLLYGREDEQLIVVGSNFGQAHHPAWTANLLAHPEATVIMGGQRIPVRAQRLSGEAASAAYRRMAELASVYDVYRGRTDREIRVFALTRAD